MRTNEKKTTSSAGGAPLKESDLCLMETTFVFRTWIAISKLKARLLTSEVQILGSEGSEHVKLKFGV